MCSLIGTVSHVSNGAPEPLVCLLGNLAFTFGFTTHEHCLCELLIQNLSNLLESYPEASGPNEGPAEARMNSLLLSN